MVEVEWLAIYLLLGGLVGFMSGLLGVGGGGILVPLLVSIFHRQSIAEAMELHLALGTALACMIVSSTASVRAHAARGLVRWSMVRGMAPGVVLGAALISALVPSLSSRFVAFFFVGFMALVALQLFVNWQPTSSAKPPSWRGLLAAGLGIGSVSALAAVGGGFLSVAYMTYKNIAIKQAIATSAAIGLAIAIAGSLGYALSGWSLTTATAGSFGFIYLPAFLAISLASVAAAPLGARWARRLPEAQLKKIFTMVSLALSVKMLLANVL